MFYFFSKKEFLSDFKYFLREKKMRIKMLGVGMTGCEDLSIVFV